MGGAECVRPGGRGGGLFGAPGSSAGRGRADHRQVDWRAATGHDDIELTLRSGDRVRWGSADQPEVKAQVLRALMNRKADVYDVAAPELPTTFRAR